MSPRLRKGLVYAASVLVILALGLGGLGVATARRSFPQVSGTVRLPGLEGTVEVYRDSMGVPHLYAESEHDLFMAQGYVHAQDRFWQMDFWRHIGSGRLSEMFGSSQVETDMFLRTLGWARVAQQEIDALEPEVRALFEAYSQGVNAYLATHTGAEASLEYAVLGLLNPDYTPEPWIPLHTLTWAKAMAWDLGGNMDQEIDRMLLQGVLEADQIAALYPDYPAGHPTIVPSLATAGSSPAAGLSDDLAGLPGIESAFRILDARREDLNRYLSGGFGSAGSNNWVIGGDRTTTGMPFLANDPHLGIQMPSIWYEVGLHCRPIRSDCSLNVTGFSFPGAPGVVIGHNDRIAWGMTNVDPDVQDLYIERINPANASQYEVNGEWVDMDLVEETIQVSDGQPVRLTVRYTRHGPIISDTYGPLQDLAEASSLELPSTYAVALRWTALEPTSTFLSILHINRAQTWEQFREAVRLFDVPSQNLVYADMDGNIGYQMPGKVPIRASGDGRVPVPGWTDEYEWTGYVPFDELPFAFNPPQGYLSTANNAVVSAEYPYLLSTNWDYGYRAMRIIERIESKPQLSIEDMQSIQGDNFNAMGPVFVPLLQKIDFGAEALNGLRDDLAGWDHNNDPDSAQAALFNAFWHHLVLNTFADELPDGPLPGDDRAFLVLGRLAEDAQNPWWNNVGTPEAEDRDDILRAAFQAAVEDLQGRLGNDSSRWTWGALHTATFANQTLGQSGIAPIEALFNRGPFAAGGGASIVNATWWSFAEGYEVLGLPSMRMIVDFSNLGNSLTIHTTGQSGHAFHPHYIDMADLWRQTQYHPMLWSFEQVRVDAEAVLTLTP